MADSIIRLKVDSQEYESKISRASEGLRAMEQACRSVGGTFEIVEDKELEFVRALGQMDTVSKNTRGQLRELTQAITNMTSMYRNLTDAEKNSPFGQALSNSIQELTERAGNAKDAMADVQASITNAASDTRAFDQVSGAMTTMTSVFQVGQGAAKMLGIEMGDNVEVLAKLQAAMAVTNGLQVIQNNLQKQSALMQGVATLQRTAATIAENLNTAAKNGNTAATVAATAAQAAFNAVAKANPYILLASAILAVGGAMIAFATNTDDSTEAMKRQEAETKRLAKSHADMSSAIGRASGDVLGKFMALRAQWMSLRTEAEKTQWLKENASNFKSMGLSINSVNTANNTFIKQAPQVIQALMDIAVAQKASEKYAEAVMTKQEKWVNRRQSVATGDFRTSVHAGQVVSGDQVEKLGLQKGEYEHVGGQNGFVKITMAGAESANARFNRQANATRKQLEAGYDSDIKMWEDFLKDAQAKSLQGQALLRNLGISSYNSSTGGGGRSGSGSGNTKTEAEKIKAQVTESYTALQILQDQLQTVQKSMAPYGKATDEWKTMNEYAQKLKAEIAALNGEFDLNPKALQLFISNLQDQVSNADFGTPLRESLTKQLADVNILQGVLAYAEQQGIDLSNLNVKNADALWQSIINGEDIADNVWQDFEKAFNEHAKDNGLKPISINVKTGKIDNGKEEKAEESKGIKSKITDNEATKTLSAVSGGLSEISGGLKSLGVELPKGFEDTINGIGGVMQIVNGIASLISIIEIFDKANGTAQTALLSDIAVNTSISASTGIIDTILPFSTGGTVPVQYAATGKSFAHGTDTVPAMLSPGETVLTRAQTGNLASQLDQTASQRHINIEGILYGEDIRLAVGNGNKRRGRGEYVTTKNRRS